ncbi:MAG: CoA transferase [Chloroflexi bacterium]|nr:CoA transferase [Chloroflexota bacterium]
MPSPLEGIRILDFTRYQNGPHGTQLLADMGAEVIKVELPGDGDPGRAIMRQPDGFCAYFEALNRGKRSITLELRTAEGKEVIRKLVQTVDVVVENFRPGVMDNLGIGYDVLAELNPKLIYAVNSGFGPDGEWSSRGSFDHVAQGMSGALVAQGGGPGATPTSVAWGLADQVGGMTLAYGVMTALVSRERFGVGQKVDVSQLGAMISLQGFSLLGYLHTGTQERRNPGASRNAAFSWYQGSDGEWFTIAGLDPKFWPRICRVLDRDDLIDDPRSVDPFARFENGPWLIEEFRAVFAGKPCEEWLNALVAEEIPCGPVYDYAGVAAEPQHWQNGYLVELDHPTFPNHRTIGMSVQLSETPGGVRGPAPELGQHTEEVLLELGYDWPDIEQLHDKGVTAAR